MTYIADNNNLMGTGVPMIKIIEIFQPTNTKELREEGIQRVQDYLKSEQYIVTDELIDMALRESLER